MEILSMLARLERALNCDGLARQMVLLPKAQSPLPTTADAAKAGAVNLVVGYDGSGRSQIALDLTLWIAHQTRLVTRKSVTVQVVYVVEPQLSFLPSPDHFSDLSLMSMDIQPSTGEKSNFIAGRDRRERLAGSRNDQDRLNLSNSVAVVEQSDRLLRPSSENCSPNNWQIQQFEKADHILWQARNLASEWRGSLETHLRFGAVAEELEAIATQVSATALMVGCSSQTHPIVKALSQHLPFPVLGIPHQLIN